MSDTSNEAILGGLADAWVSALDDLTPRKVADLVKGFEAFFDEERPLTADFIVGYSFGHSAALPTDPLARAALSMFGAPQSWTLLLAAWGAARLAGKA